uniref:Uncharacterized protein n=1 Tax=Chromera velia CCMP2878 TaxID=1169474 RepID=A0A0G4HDD9_9ALVE|eukprot:Cvel_26467.t1-p1 / transcript=Cvel_26467.t1 / gene=Cvel_26467 / organism=Chromera_velia_CCMP2878 / gene_product=hypothetical protein / transcript_product=hypothetical protein / location=Cvel_scaffold3149:7440-17432(-) / protein_length=1029 / sequence_SO=supercontig / SO=protein_coding / is_pseudo=false
MKVSGTVLLLLSVGAGAFDFLEELKGLVPSGLGFFDSPTAKKSSQQAGPFVLPVEQCEALKGPKAKCGDGKLNLSTEECDDGEDNGKPGSICLADCTYAPEARCGELVIDTLAAYEEAQICGTAYRIRVTLPDEIDFTLRNLRFVFNLDDGPGGFLDFEASTGIKSILMPNLIWTRSGVRITGDQNFKLESASFPSYLFPRELFVNDAPLLRSFSAPRLLSATSFFGMNNLTMLESLDLQSLLIPQNLQLIDLPALREISLPSFKSTQFVDIRDMPLLERIDLPSLYAVEEFEFVNLPALKTLNAPQFLLTSGIPQAIDGGFQNLGSAQIRFCSLPAFEVRTLNEVCAGTCTVFGPTSDICRTEIKKEDEVGKGKVLPGFDLSGLAEMKGGNSLQQSDEGALDVFSSPWGTQKGEGKEKEKERGECPEFPLTYREKAPPVCGNGIVEAGEECDGDERVCENETCTFKASAVCGDADVNSEIFLNSTADVESILDCAVILSRIVIADGVPPVIELPLAEIIQTFQPRTGLELTIPLRKLSLPRARVTGTIDFEDPGISFPALEEIDLPCVRFVREFLASSTPLLKVPKLPKVETIRSVSLDGCADAPPSDFILPSAFSVTDLKWNNCPSLRNVELPVAAYFRTDMEFRNNTGLSSILVPESCVSASPQVELINNPSLQLTDLSSQVFIDADTFNGGSSIDIIFNGGVFEEGSSPDGIVLQFCSLFVTVAEGVVERGCNATEPSTPSGCFVQDATSKECGGAKKEKAKTDLFGGLGALPPLKFDLNLPKSEPPSATQPVVVSHEQPVLPSVSVSGDISSLSPDDAVSPTSTVTSTAEGSPTSGGTAHFRKEISEEEMDTFVEELTDFCTRNGVQSKKSFDRAVWTIRNKMKLSPSKRQMVDAYLRLTEAKRIPHNPTVEHQMVGKGLGKEIVEETQTAQDRDAATEILADMYQDLLSNLLVDSPSSPSAQNSSETNAHTGTGGVEGKGEGPSSKTTSSSTSTGDGEGDGDGISVEKEKGVVPGGEETTGSD